MTFQTASKATSRIVRSTEVDDDGDRLKHRRFGATFQLNATGRHVWTLLARPLRFSTLVKRLAAHHGVHPSKVETDLAPFIEQLQDLSFIEAERATRPIDRMRERYLDLLKRALVNLIYPEHELRIRHLSKAREDVDPPARNRYLRDIRRLEAQTYETLIQDKHVNCGLGGFSHTLIGLKRLLNIQYCAERVFADRIEGDFMEAGVYRGGAAVFMRALQVVHDKLERCTWVADSFQGCPPPQCDRDTVDMSEPHYPMLAIDRGTVEETFATYDLLDGHVRFLEGWFCDTLPAAAVERLSILRMDADLYSSTRDVLDAMYDRVCSGGFVIVDDYLTSEPCRAAVDTFRAERGIRDRLRPVDFNAVFWRKS